MEQQQAILTKELADMLGFDDGVDSILQHLLTIESSKDLLDYMTELFGSNNELQLRSFVDDVGRVQRGELIVELDDEKEEETGKVPKATTMPLVTLTKTSLPRKTEAAVPSNKKATSASTTKKAVPVAKLSASIPNSSKTTKDFTEYKQSPLTADQGSQSALRKEDEGSAGATPIIKTPPPKGTAAFICGCFGSIHKALTNCLFCGRISCEKEGYDYCPFCGYLVEEVKSWADGSTASENNEAWKHKERLLRYDREFAERTVIVDDQSDYYSNATSVWLSADEQAQAAKLEQQRQDEIHKRKKMQLNLAL